MMSERIVLGLLLLAGAGCAVDPLRVDEPEPTAELADVRPQLDETFRLAVGEFASVEEGNLLVAFVGATDDSRCPIDVDCVWAGDAELTVGVASDGGSWRWAILHTTLEPRLLTDRAFTITVEGLEPEPRSTVTIEPEDYVAVLRVTRE